MTHKWQLVLGIFPVLLFFPLAAKKDSHPSLSLVTMVPLLELEKKLIDNLDDYVKALDHKLQLLRSHILDIRAENEKAELDPIQYLSNPLNSFSLIRRLHQDWVGWRKFMEQSVGIVQMRKMNSWQRELPTKEDLSEACDGIIRIQITYNLRVDDIIRGKLKGRQYNVSMSPSDIFAVGNHLRHTSIFLAAFLWLREIRPPSQENSVSQPDHIISTEKKVIKVLTDMHVKEGYFSMALRFINYWLQLFPYNAYPERARRALKKLMKTKSETPYGRPLDLARDLDTKQLRWSCSKILKSRPSSHLQCSYNSSTTPFLRLAPLKMEQIGLDPYVVLYHDVLSPGEISQLQKMEFGPLKTAVVGGTDNRMRRLRSGKTFSISCEFNRLTKRIKRRIEDISGLDLSGSENLQVLNYGIGGHFDMHTDFRNISSSSGVRQPPDRIATVLFYLSDVEQGGETVFPHAGYSVKPRAGTALFWYNLHTDGIGDLSTIHAACPVILGSKWIMTQWISEEPQWFKRPCLRPSPSQLSKQRKRN
ncbi:prolyl 4-hydroxylase subunit alpha-1-like [Drosophila serrata]|uniref:prolyl 4-hydroxylase subunit alpha-1-like n=1 Tax=Drosophila serrata TaxID=7274 RepID=UPI000A1CF3D4|nr:prolyl 4-hydroxylase subunit alpha-1-like [Drosophila serrata]